jgi:hypothetical protein
MTRKQKILLGVTISSLVIILLFLILPAGKLLLKFSYDEDKLKFNKELWMINWQTHRNDENDRHYMLKDITTNHLIIGVDSTEVKKLLGEPERDFGFSYNLGLYRSGFDPTFLILEFDDKGKLRKVNVETI